MSREQRISSEKKEEFLKLEAYFKNYPLEMSALKARWLLNTLCVELGYCLSPIAITQFLENPPQTPHTKSVYLAP